MSMRWKSSSVSGVYFASSSPCGSTYASSAPRAMDSSAISRVMGAFPLVAFTAILPCANPSIKRSLALSRLRCIGARACTHGAVRICSRKGHVPRTRHVAPGRDDMEACSCWAKLLFWWHTAACCVGCAPYSADMLSRSFACSTLEHSTRCCPSQTRHHSRGASSQTSNRSTSTIGSVVTRSTREVLIRADAGDAG